MKKMIEKKTSIDRQIELAYGLHFNGIMVDIWAIPEIFRLTRQALGEGVDINDFMKSLLPRFDKSAEVYPK